MNYTIGIDIDPKSAAIVLLDEMGNTFPTDHAMTVIPRLSTVSDTGETLVGLRAVRYSRLHHASPTDTPDDTAFFAHIAAYLRAQLHCDALPPVVLSFYTTDPHAQRALAQAAHASGLPVLRCLNRAAACAIADRFSLLHSGGSDFHGSNKPDIRLGVGRGDMEVPLELYEKLKRKYRENLNKQ